MPDVSGALGSFGSGGVSFAGLQALQGEASFFAGALMQAGQFFPNLAPAPAQMVVVPPQVQLVNPNVQVIQDAIGPVRVNGAINVGAHDLGAHLLGIRDIRVDGALGGFEQPVLPMIPGLFEEEVAEPIAVAPRVVQRPFALRPQTTGLYVGMNQALLDTMRAMDSATAFRMSRRESGLSPRRRRRG